MKEENERIVTEKQVPEIDDKVVQCKSNIKQAVEELKRKHPEKQTAITTRPEQTSVGDREKMKI